MAKKIAAILVTITMVLGMTLQVWAASDKTVSFYTEKGKIICRQQVTGDGELVLPSCSNTKNYTFLGWSLRKGGRVRYRAGDIIKVRKNLKLYQVMFDQKTENNISYEQMPHLSDAYSEVIFVGDSRTVYMQQALISEFGADAFPEVKFIAKSSTRLQWLKGTAYSELLREISRVRKTDSRPIAVVFNHGVNDLNDADKKNFNSIRVARRFSSYMNRIAPRLESRGCRLFYMSVNPFNSASLLRRGKRTEQDLFKFNAELESRLGSAYTFLDTCTLLYRKGYTTFREELQLDDGLHYNNRTYKRIYSMCIKSINRQPGVFTSGIN